MASLPSSPPSRLSHLACQALYRLAECGPASKRGWRWWPMIWELGVFYHPPLLATLEDTQATTDSASGRISARPSAHSHHAHSRLLTAVWFAGITTAHCLPIRSASPWPGLRCNSITWKAGVWSDTAQPSDGRYPRAIGILTRQIAINRL